MQVSKGNHSYVSCHIKKTISSLLNTVTKKKVVRYRVCQIRREIVAFISHFWTGVDIES